MQDRVVRNMTINLALMVFASTILIVGAIVYATGILLALEAR